MDELTSCPVCKCNRISLRFAGKTTRNPKDPQHWRVSGCENCGLGFLNPRPSWEELEPYYSTQYAAYTSCHGATGTDDEVIRIAKSSGCFRHIPVPSSKRLLDIGCGGGYFLRICAKLGAEVQGVEPSPIAATEARAQGLPVFQGMLGEFETDRKFDVITANQVLEHSPDPVAMLRQMRSLLAPYGMIWIAVPNGECRWAKELGWQWDGADLPYHLMHFGPQSIRRAADRAELRLQRLYTYSEPWIVRWSMSNYFRSNYGIPRRLTNLLFSEARAAILAQKMDSDLAGDTLILELCLPA